MFLLLSEFRHYIHTHTHIYLYNIIQIILCLLWAPTWTLGPDQPEAGYRGRKSEIRPCLLPQKNALTGTQIRQRQSTEVSLQRCKNRHILINHGPKILAGLRPTNTFSYFLVGMKVSKHNVRLLVASKLLKSRVLQAILQTPEATSYKLLKFWHSFYICLYVCITCS